MIETALIYIYSMTPTRRFVGCGALLEGDLVVTCRHVWEAVVRNTPADAVLEVEVEFPRVKDAKGAPHRARGVLADDCTKLEGAAPDVVIVELNSVPHGAMRLRPATHERYEVGAAFARIGLIGRDKLNPERMEDRTVEGHIGEEFDSNDQRQFSGRNQITYWPDRGASGSPIFIEGGEQLAGIVARSETGVNEGKSVLREASIVPGTIVRAHLERHLYDREAARLGVAPEAAQALFDNLKAQSVPVAHMPAELRKVAEEARRNAAAAPAASEGSDIDAVIAASREKMVALDAVGAHALLDAKLAEEEAARRRRMVPLLTEKASIARLSHDYGSGAAALRALVTLSPDDVWPWVELGDLYVTNGSLTDALTSYRNGHAAARRTGAKRDVSVCCNRISDTLVALGELPAALQSASEGLEIVEQLSAAQPGNSQWRRDVWVSYNMVGDVLVRQGNLNGAAKRYRDGVEIAEQLSAASPDDRDLRRDILVSYTKLGGVLVEQGDLPGALKRFRDSREIAEQLCKADPASAEWRRDLWLSHVKVGDVLLDQEDTAGALDCYRDAVDLAERLAKIDPGNVVWRRDVSVSYNKLGDALIKQSDPGGALARFRSALEIADQLAKADPGNAEWRRDVWVSHTKVGDALLEQGEAEEALTWFSGGLAIVEQLSATDFGNAQWRRDVAASFLAIARAHEKAGRKAEAIQALKSGEAIMVELTDLSPENAVWRGDLAEFKASIARVSG